MKKASPLIGKRIHWIVVISTESKFATCRCDCGNIFRVWKANLYRENTKSCGCLKKTCGGMQEKFKNEHKTWKDMMRRCLDPANISWGNYGARGITVCKEWHYFPTFLRDMGTKPSKEMSLDRIDCNANYEPDNCRWATRHDQANNTRRNRFMTIGGVKKTYSQWRRETGINKSTFYYRLQRGIKPEVAIFP